eukprot:10859035-Lingulodinium_polyedra.AAC.1
MSGARQTQPNAGCVEAWPPGAPTAVQADSLGKQTPVGPLQHYAVSPRFRQTTLQQRIRRDTPGLFCNGTRGS